MTVDTGLHIAIVIVLLMIYLRDSRLLRDIKRAPSRIKRHIQMKRQRQE